MTEQEAIRPEFLERYRVVSNGRLFRVEYSCRTWWFGWSTAWHTVQGEYDGPPTIHPSEAAARIVLRGQALLRQREHDEAQHGWRPVEVEATQQVTTEGRK